MGNAGSRSVSRYRRLESRKGSGRSSTPLTTLKMAVFAPIPSARVRTATAVNPPFLCSMRKAYARLARAFPMDPLRIL